MNKLVDTSLTAKEAKRRETWLMLHFGTTDLTDLTDGCGAWDDTSFLTTEDTEYTEVFLGMINQDMNSY